MEWIARLVDLSKVPTRLIAVLAITSGLILLLPSSWLEQIALDQFRKEFAPYLGAALVLSVAILLIELGIWCYCKWQEQRSIKSAEEAVRDSMQALDRAEKAVLREFCISATRSLRLPIEQPAVASLLNSGVLVRATSAGVRTTVGSVFSLTLSETAEALLSPTLLDLGPFLTHTDDGKWDVTDEGAEWLRDNRPRFMPELERHFSIREGTRW